jgi:hypothetical protein
MDSALSLPAEPADALTTGASALPAEEPGVVASASPSVTATSAATTGATAPPRDRSAADRTMRRLLRLPVDAPRESIFGTESIFGRSIAISAIRCLVTYVFLPLLAPVVKVSGAFGPLLGLALGAVSMVAIVMSMRRFFAADHKWRWGYAGVGAGIFVLLIVAGVSDIVNLAS